MANFFENKDRKAVPNWRSFTKTTILGELDSFQTKKSKHEHPHNIDEYLSDWIENKTIPHAADLLSAALVNSKQNKLVHEAANFILENKSNASKSQILLAHILLDRPQERDLSNIFRGVTLDNFSSFVNPFPFRVKIKETKEAINTYPFNPIYYVELSRYYSILGQERNAINAMKKAIHLAKDNRFVLRSATRLFTNYSDVNNDHLDYIHNILKNSCLTNFDPWLTSAEISIAALRGRDSKFIKRGLELVNSGNVSPFGFTELACNLGTMELLNGSTKKSRTLFEKALINPNDNSLAQVEWASTKDKQIIINPNEFEVKMNFEALALDTFHKKDFESSLDNAVKWFMDMPFSKMPVMFASNLASTILKNQDVSISFLQAGLISHPNDPLLLNNLAYALALNNQPQEALSLINKLKTDDDDVTQICLTATKGLAYFRNGYTDVGRVFYLDAIERTKKINNPTLNWIAVLNYAREELLLKSEYIESVMQAVAKIPNLPENIEISTLKADVETLFKIHNQNH